MIPYVLSRKMAEPFVFLGKEKVILSQAKRDKNIIYGAQSIKKQIGFFGRETQDYDVYSNRPRYSAKKLEKNLDNKAHSDVYYMKPALHRGTYKVKYVGQDKKKFTRDDIDVADFTVPKRNVKYIMIKGIRYSHLSESIKDKYRALLAKKYAFRHAKDKNDIDRIHAYKSFKKNKILGG